VRRALALAAGLIALSALVAPPTSGAERKGPSVDPAMSRGPAAAPVTIFEFSDYQ
jgi:hypothetical protein